MTLSEFKAWFEGFTECMDGAPDKDQWKRIKARVKEIDGTAITRTVYLDRYVAPYRHYRDWPFYNGSFYGSGVMGAGASFPQNTCMATSQNSAGKTDGAFDAHSAMMDLGRAEYSAPPRSI